MTIPSLIDCEHLRVEGNFPRTFINKRWITARPLPFYGRVGGIEQRIKLAWGVFIGKYDALKWEGQP